MKTSYASAIVLALSALAAGHASAGTGPDPYGEVMGSGASTISAAGKTRAQVLKELADAQRTGNIVANVGGEKSGVKLVQLYPTQFATQEAPIGKSRSQIMKELSEAQRTGDIVVNVGGSHGGLKQNQVLEQQVFAE
ncbi:DUF4148 domain-containing protein [Rhodoferax sp. GW822-FHT02A01]|uniref:DUF4148 domain-containing protein n=1 Tax=Rhodoferax sp. GW822-FHT02A01 TaxID=3141537 RepID=UPI00315D791C